MHPEFEKFLNPDNFMTKYDSMLQNAELGFDQYKKGLEVGNNAKEINISINEVWSSDNKDGSMTSSSERIGYHAETKELLRGFLDSTAKVIVHREIDGKIVSQVIKEAGVHAI